jgi:hypothetical protein
MSTQEPHRSRFRPQIVRRSAHMPVGPVAPTPPGPSLRRYNTRIIPFWLIGRIWQLLTIVLLIASFIVSWLGNVGMFVWPAWSGLGSLSVWQGWTGAALGWAFVYQLIVQVCQAYSAREYGRDSILYRLFLAISVIPSIWTYSLVVVPWAGSAQLWGDVWLIRIPAYLVSAVLLIVLLIANDVLQEYMIVRDA